MHLIRSVLILCFVQPCSLGEGGGNLILGGPQTAQIHTSCEAYYPLSLGNNWTYEGIAVTAVPAGSGVTWRVDKVIQKGGRNVFWLWPKPTDGDEEHRRLMVSKSGVTEVDDSGVEYYVLKCPPQIGESWHVTPPDQSSTERAFKILSLSKTCRVREFRFRDCVKVEEDRGATNLRIVTTYGKHVGPVRIEYYAPAGQGKAKKLLQAVELKSYEIRNQ